MTEASISLVLLLASLAGLTAELSFKDDCLYWHNHYRKIHQAGPLTWSTDLQNKAQAYVDELAKKDKIGNDGESSVVAWPGLPSPICKRTVNYIYNFEAHKYNYSNPGINYIYGHFTVMVWKSSTELGAAYARSTSGGTYVVFKYKPLGNEGGKYRDNVLPPLLPLCNATLDYPVTRAPCHWPTTEPPTNGSFTKSTVTNTTEESTVTNTTEESTVTNTTEGGSIPGVKASSLQLLSSLGFTLVIVAAGLLINYYSCKEFLECL